MSLPPILNQTTDGDFQVTIAIMHQNVSARNLPSRSKRIVQGAVRSRCYLEERFKMPLQLYYCTVCVPTLLVNGIDLKVTEISINSNAITVVPQLSTWKQLLLFSPPDIITSLQGFVITLP